MSMNLLDSIKGEINSIVIDKISNYLNIARGNTSNAVTAAIPSMLGYLSEKSKTEAGATSIVKAATDNELSSMFNGNSFQDLFERNRDSLMSKGNSFLIDIFGGKEASYSEEISKYANISKEASDGVLAAIFPLVLSAVGNRISNDGLDSSNLTNLFERENESIFSAIPAGLASLGGILGLSSMGAKSTTSTMHTEPVKPVENVTPKPTATKTTQEDRKTYIKEDENKSGGMMKWLLPLLGIIAAAILLYFLMKQCKNDDAEVTPTEQVTSTGVAEYTLDDNQTVVNAAGVPLLGADGSEMVVDGTNYKLNDDNFVVNAEGVKALDKEGKEIKIVDELAAAPSDIKGTYDSESNRFIYDLGDERKITLPTGIDFTVGEFSSESKLFDFLSDENSMVSEDKTQGWITLDKIYFVTNKAELIDDSKEQLDNIAALLEAYPDVEVKFGGYTDNRGGQDINQPLSEARAQSAMDYVVNKGIDANRLAAEGYGQEHPVCPANDTPECMAKNRRTAIRITKK